MEKTEKTVPLGKKKENLENFIAIIKIMLSVIYINLHIAISEFTL